MESTARLNADLEEVEKRLNEMCQNVIKATINKQKEDIVKELEQQSKNLHEISNSPIIKINVGGKKFTTTLATLTSLPESKLAKMFTGALPIAKDDKDVYFIDRNGEYFTYILDYLREKVLLVPSDAFLTKKVREEMEFFELKPEVSTSTWTWDPTKQAGVSMTNNNMTITKTGSAGCGITYGQQLFESGIHRWKVNITHVNNHYWICAGLFDEAVCPFSAGFNYANSWSFSSYGEAHKMTGTGPGIMLSDGDVYEMEYDVDSGKFDLTVPKKGVKLTANAKGSKMRAFAYVWTVGDSLTLSFD